MPLGSTKKLRANDLVRCRNRKRKLGIVISFKNGGILYAEPELETCPSLAVVMWEDGSIEAIWEDEIELIENKKI